MMCLIAIICIQVMLLIYKWYIYPFCILDESLGVENDPLGQADKMGGEKTIKIISKDQILLYEKHPFLKLSNTGNFDRQISPWKQHLQKKQSIPRQQKIQDFCHLRFFIFELSSQRFFDLKLAIFRFLKNSKKCKFLQTWPSNFGCFLNT